MNFMQLFERLLEIPITWSRGRANGEVLHYNVNWCLDAPTCIKNAEVDCITHHGVHAIRHMYPIWLLLFYRFTFACQEEKRFLIFMVSLM